MKLFSEFFLGGSVFGVLVISLIGSLSSLEGFVNDYLVWYRETEKGTDVVAGVCRCYESGRATALQMQFVLKYFEKKEVYQVGITRIPINKVNLAFREVEFPTRWVVVENGIEIPEED